MKPTPDLEELDAIIAARVEFEEMFWQGLGQMRRDGVSANEIARRVHAAGIASRPTTLDRLRPYGAGTRVAEAMKDMQDSVRRTTASLHRLVNALDIPDPVTRMGFDLTEQVAEILGDRVDRYDLDGIVTEITQTFGLGDRPNIESIHQIPPAHFWEIIERHPHR